MVNRASVPLVIDACVARASGPPDATYPTSQYCRDLLITVLANFHRIVMTPEIREEWKEHESGFARSWRAKMLGKKKLEFIRNASDMELRDAVEQAAGSESIAIIMLKDIHLIEAAIQRGKIVISLETKVRYHFNVAANEIRKLKEIAWVNPDNKDETPIEWLESGAPREPFRLLGYNPPVE